MDVVDDRCDPSVFELTRREPRRSAPAKADSRLSGFGFDPVRNPNMCPGARISNRSDGSLNGFRSLPLESLTLRSLPSIAVRRPRRRLLELSSESLALWLSVARQSADSSISRGFGTPNNLSRGARAGPRGDYKPLRVSFRVCWSGFCKMPNMLRTRVLHLQALKGLQKRVQDRCDWSRSPHNLRRHQRESHFCQPLAPPQAYQQHSARSSVKKIDDVQRSREIVRPG